MKPIDTIQTALEAYVQECPSEAKSIDKAWSLVTRALRWALDDLEEDIMPRFSPDNPIASSRWGATIKELKKLGVK